MAQLFAGGEEIFTAKLEIRYSRNPKHQDDYGKIKELEPGANREVVNVRLEASSLEKLQEKLIAYVGLAEL